jgi:hypothetical protein
LVNDRRRITRDHNRSIDFPTHLAAVLVDGDQVRRGIVLIHWQDYLVVNKYRGRAEAVEHVEWTKWKSPALFAILVERKHPGFLEEDVNVGAVSHRARRRRAIHVLQTAGARARHLAFPEDFSRLPIEADHE